MSKTHISRKLRQLLKNKFGSYKKASIALSMSPQNLQKYLDGERVPGGEVLIRLLEVGCDLNWLFDTDVPEDIGIVSDGKAEYGVKDKFINAQAIEISKLRAKVIEVNKELEDLKNQIKKINIS